MGNKLPKYKPNLLKANLQMAKKRIEISKNKRSNENAALRNEIAQFLRNGEEEKALIKVESIINNENFLVAIELVSTFCMQCSERIHQITESKTVPNDLWVAIETIIYATSTFECEELVKAREQFASKYGVQFCRNAINNTDGQVNSIVREKLPVIVPDEELKFVKLKEIASEKNVNYVPSNQVASNYKKFPGEYPGGYPGGYPQYPQYPESLQTYDPQYPQGPQFNGYAMPPSLPAVPRESSLPDPPQNLPEPSEHSDDLDSLEERFRKLR